MLTFFPTPYPDELFYSVLCRWYLMAGLREHKVSKDALFGLNSYAHMGTIYPNTVVSMVAKQLPEGLFTARRFLLQNTTFPYYMRMYDHDARMQLLEDIAEGRGEAPSRLWTIDHKSYFLRYCPCCVTEDTNIYGEPYYHVEHQIPLVQVCRKHHCRLRPIPLEACKTYLNDVFLPLSTIAVDAEPDYAVTESEIAISQIAHEYMKLPISVGPTPGHSNLYQELLNRGYGRIRSQNGRYIDTDKLYRDLCAFHGQEAVHRAFSDGKIDPRTVYRLRRWKTIYPDRYILIQAMLGMPTETVFGEEPLPDAQEEMLRAMEARGEFCTEKQIMEQTGLKAYQLNALLREFGMERFWVEEKRRRSIEPKTKHVYISMTGGEMAELRAVAEKLGYRGLSQFAVDCMRSVIQQNLTAAIYYENNP